MKANLASGPQRGLRLRKMIAGIGILFAMGVLATTALVASPEQAAAATVSFSQCNDRNAGPGGAPLSVTCSVNIINNITPTGNTSTVTYTRTCALNPCTGNTVSSVNVVNSVNQCNGSDNVGGSTMVCQVNVTNNISVSPASAATAITVNQCVGSGSGGGTLMTGCVPSSQGSPTVTQCNGSGTGGGGAMTCNASGTRSSTFPVTVNQCNGSENGGGSFVTCTVSITNNITVAPTGTAPSGGSSGPAPTQTTTSTGTATPSSSPGVTQTPQSGASQPPQTGVILPPQTGDGGLLEAGSGDRSLYAPGAAVALLLSGFALGRRGSKRALAHVAGRRDRDWRA